MGTSSPLLFFVGTVVRAFFEIATGPLLAILHLGAHLWKVTHPLVEADIIGNERALQEKIEVTKEERENGDWKDLVQQPTLRQFNRDYNFGMRRSLAHKNMHFCFNKKDQAIRISKNVPKEMNESVLLNEDPWYSSEVNSNFTPFVKNKMSAWLKEETGLEGTQLEFINCFVLHMFTQMAAAKLPEFFALLKNDHRLRKKYESLTAQCKSMADFDYEVFIRVQREAIFFWRKKVVVWRRVTLRKDYSFLGQEKGDFVSWKRPNFQLKKGSRDISGYSISFKNNNDPKVTVVTRKLFPLLS